GGESRIARPSAAMASSEPTWPSARAAWRRTFKGCVGSFSRSMSSLVVPAEGCLVSLAKVEAAGSGAEGARVLAAWRPGVGTRVRADNAEGELLSDSTAADGPGLGRRM